MAAVNFMTNETTIDLTEKSVEISKLLLWYQKDFVQSKNDEQEKKTTLLKFENKKKFLGIK